MGTVLEHDTLDGLSRIGPEVPGDFVAVILSTVWALHSYVFARTTKLLAGLTPKGLGSYQFGQDTLEELVVLRRDHLVAGEGHLDDLDDLWLLLHCHDVESKID